MQFAIAENNVVEIRQRFVSPNSLQQIYIGAVFEIFPLSIGKIRTSYSFFISNAVYYLRQELSSVAIHLSSTSLRHVMYLPVS